MSENERVLKSCPFCGGDARVGGDAEDSDAGYYVACQSVECFAAMGERYDRDAMPEHFFATEEEAVAAWNTRAHSFSDARAQQAAERAAERIMEWRFGIDKALYPKQREVYHKTILAAIDEVRG